MKLKIFTLVIGSLSILFFIYIFSLDVQNPFLSSLRYKAYEQKAISYYNMEVLNYGDTLFFHRIGFSTCEWQSTITWFGDTLGTIPSIACGQYRPEHINEVFSGYDSTIIKITEKRLIPLKIGQTQLFVQYPVGRDTVNLDVRTVKNRLVINVK